MHLCVSKRRGIKRNSQVLYKVKAWGAYRCICFRWAKRIYPLFSSMKAKYLYIKQSPTCTYPLCFRGQPGAPVYGMEMEAYGIGIVCPSPLPYFQKHKYMAITIKWPRTCHQIS